jgi:secreted trypsin-like serine protease
MVNDQIKKVQYGIVSFGTQCGSSEPGIYAKVHSYLEWILNNMRPLSRA